MGKTAWHLIVHFQISATWTWNSCGFFIFFQWELQCMWHAKLYHYVSTTYSYNLDNLNTNSRTSNQHLDSSCCPIFESNCLNISGRQDACYSAWWWKSLGDFQVRRLGTKDGSAHTHLVPWRNLMVRGQWKMLMMMLFQNQLMVGWWMM